MKHLSFSSYYEKLTVDEKFLQALKYRLTVRTGLSIHTKKDCAKISEMILQTDCGYVSQSTIYRLFFLPGKHKPYPHTIDVLCQFIGFNSGKQFAQTIQHTAAFQGNVEKKLSEEETKQSLLFSCIETASFNALNRYFDNMASETIDTRERVSIDLFDCLQSCSNPVHFLKHYAKHPYVREYFFEKGHDPKFRIKKYPLGYMYYLKNTDSNNALQDVIFGNCVLFRYHYLSGAYNQALTIGKKIYNEQIVFTELKNNIDIFPFSRYVAYKLWYLQVRRDSAEQVEKHITVLLETCRSIKYNLVDSERNILFHTLSEAISCSRFEKPYQHKLLAIISKILNQIPNTNSVGSLNARLVQFEPNGLLLHRP